MPQSRAQILTFLLSLMSLPAAAEDARPRSANYGDPLPSGVLARMGTVRFRPGEGPHAICLSSDGKLLATGESHKLRLWDAANGKEVRCIDLPRVERVCEIVFSPDGKRLAVCFNPEDGSHRAEKEYRTSLSICDATEGKIICDVPGETSAYGKVMFTPDGKSLLAIDWGKKWDKSLRRLVIWDAATGKEQRHFAQITRYDLSPDGKLLAGGSDDGVIYLWDRATGRELRQLKGHSGRVCSLLFLPDGKTLVSGGSYRPKPDNENTVAEPDFTVRFWDVARGVQRRCCAGHDKSVYELICSPDGSVVASKDVEERVILWEAATGANKHTFPPMDGSDGSYPRRTIGFAPGGKHFIWQDEFFGCLDHVIHEWDIAAGKESRQWNVGSSVAEMAFSLEGKRLVTRCTDDCVHPQWSRLLIWDIASGKEESAGAGHTFPVGALAFSPDGRLLVSVDEQQGLGVWDAATGKPIAEFDGHTQTAMRFAFVGKGRQLVAVGKDGMACVWELPSGKEVRRFRVADDKTIRRWRRYSIWAAGCIDAYEGKEDKLILTRDGSTLAVFSGDANNIRLWDTASGKVSGVLKHNSDVEGIEFSPDGRELVSAEEEGDLHLWDLTTRKETAQLRGGESRADFAFSPDGRWLAWGSGGDVRLRDRAIGKELRRIAAEPPFVFHGGGRALATGRGPVSLWDLSTSRELRRLTALRENECDFHGARLFAAPDGRVLAYASNDAPTPGSTLRDVASGRELSRIESYEDEKFALSSDGRLLAVGGRKGVVLRETASGGVLGRLPAAHRGHITALAFSPDGHTLATGGSDTTILTWDYAAAIGLDATARALSDRDLAALWNDLADKDAPRAYRAIGQLIASSDRAVPLLRARIHPASDKDDEPIRKLIAVLDHDDFDVRENASKELAAKESEAETALRKALDSRPPAEARRRIEALLAAPSLSRWSPDALRRIRAVQALERIGSTEARKLLTELAAGRAEAPLTDDAQAALRRHEAKVGPIR